jgi:subtilisin family serine protease
VEIELLGADLAPSDLTEPLNPPVPAGRDPGGVAVALFDSGLNYTLPTFAGRLARDAGGKALGYDFWDMDERPFDNNPAGSPFFPARHGTAVASVLLQEAPEARFLPYRYPRREMSRMADMIEAAAGAGARIVAMPMGSNRRKDWEAFAAAARAHPEMLFVISAGNNGRDIDEAPVYPAALPLDNFLVVTSSDDLGRLAPGSNWGRESVDLMVPAEKIYAVDFDGAPQQASGSSFAVPRIAALAARLLADHPGWQAPELKAAILARALPPPGDGHSPVRHGWVADPAKEGPR